MNNDKQKSAGKIIGWKVLARFLTLLILLYGANVFSASRITHSWQSVYGSFYNGHFYLGVGNSFAVLPNVSGPFHLIAQIIKSTFKSQLMSRGIFRRSFHSSGSIKYTHEKMVDCSAHDVAIEDPVLRSLLLIQTGCINETEPLWMINASPVWPFSVPGFDARELEQVPLYQLYQLMYQHHLRFINLQPSKIISGASGQVTGTVTAYTCTHFEACFAIEFEFTMAEEHKWLLEELIVRTQAEPRPIPWRKKSDLKISSVLERTVIDQVVNGLSCLLDHSRAPGRGQSLPCKGNHKITVQDDFKWRFIASNNEMLNLSWIYAGVGYRILPLQSCRAGAGESVWQCPSYLVWSQDTSSWSEFAESKPVLSILRDTRLTDYQARYFAYDLHGIGFLKRNVNHAEKLLKYLISLPASLGIYADSYAPLAEGALVPFQQNRELVPLINVAITSALFSGVEKDFQAFKKSMEPVSLPAKKPHGRGGGGHRGRGVVHGEDHHQVRAPGNGRGRGNPYQPNGRGGRGNGGFGPPFPGGAAYFAVANQYDVSDMLRQLSSYGFQDNLLPLTPDLATAITETIDLNGVRIIEFRSQMESAFGQQAGLLEGRLTQPIQQVFGLLMTGHFDPLNVNHIITLSELSNQDLLIFLASTPGLHGYKYYRRGTLNVISGGLNDSLPKVDRNTLALAYSPSPPGFKRMGLPGNKAGRILPLGVDELLLSYRHFMPSSFATDTDVKGLINSILQEYFSDSTLEVLRRSRQHLARAGLLSFCPVERLNSDRYFYSKTLLENIEWFWQNNREHLLADPVLFFKALENAKIEKELRVSSRQRFDLSMGQVGESEFETMFFVEMALPAMRNLVETQHQIVGMLMDILKQKTFVGEQGWRAAVYGGAATRSHLLAHCFMGDLDLAVGQGAMSVNDVDVMVSSEVMRDMLVTLLKDHLRKEMTSLNVREVTLDKEHLHIHILKICYDWARVFSIDISYSDKPGYFDFSGVASMELPAYQGTRGTIELPVIGLENLLTRMVHERDMPGNDVETARRREKARWNLQLFAKGDDVVKTMLEELVPSKPDLPDVIPEELVMSEYSLETVSLEEPRRKPLLPDLGLADTTEKELSESQQEDIEPLVQAEAEAKKEPEPDGVLFHQLVDEKVRKKKNDRGRRERIRRRKKQAQVEAMKQCTADKMMEDVVQETVSDAVQEVIREERDAKRERKRATRIEALKRSITKEMMKDAAQETVQEAVRDVASEVLQEETEMDAATISTPLAEAAPEPPSLETAVKPVISLIRTEGLLDVEEKPDWSEQREIVSYEPEPDRPFSVDPKRKWIESEVLGDGTVSLSYSGATTMSEQITESALTYTDFHQIIPDDESELPGITGPDMKMVSARTVSGIELDDSPDEKEEVATVEKPEENQLEVLWQQSSPVRMDFDLYSDQIKPEPVLGWATFQEQYSKGNVYLADKFIHQLKALQARSVRIDGAVIVLLESSVLKNTGQGGLNYSIPDFAYLEARMMPWHINDGRLLLTLYRARYFHQAFPRLVAILGDPRSRLFQPVSLVKMAKEFCKATYPVNRRYEIVGDIPEWPEPEAAIKRMTDLLMAESKERGDMLKRYSRIFLNELEQGYFHAGLGMVILQLGGFSQSQQNFLASRVEYEHHSALGAQWLLARLKSPKRIEYDDFYLYRQWQAFRHHYKKGTPDVVELKEVYGQFRSLAGVTPENGQDYWPEQLMVLDDELYMKFGWLAEGMKAYKKRKASQDDYDGYVLLGHMMLSVYFHLEQNIEFMMDVLRLRQFRALASARGELDKNYPYGDLIDQGIFKRFLLRLHGAWVMTQGDEYLKASEKLLNESRDNNSTKVVEWFHSQLQQK